MCRFSRRRGGYSLLELIVTMGTSTIVMAGLASSLYISSKALEPDGTATADSNRSALALSQLTGDLRLALGFTERTAKAATFTVPDRTGDGLEETLRYSWSGTVGDSLMYQFNGSTAVALAGNVSAFNLTALTRTIPAATLAPATVTYQSFAEGKAPSGATSMLINTPSGTSAGNLLIAAMVVNGNVSASLAAPSGWTLLQRSTDSTATVTTAVWWKLAASSEPASAAFTWTSSQLAYGWIMRFSGNRLVGPIHAWSSTVGSSASSAPPSPSVTTTIPSAMIVRVGGFDNGRVTTTPDPPGTAGVSGHTTITADRANTATTGTSGAAAYAMQATAGASGAATFALTSAERYVTFTIAIAPDDGT